MRVISVKNCGGNNVVAVDKNFTASLSKDCIITTMGCITSKGFQQAKVKAVRSDNNYSLFTTHFHKSR